MLCPKCGQNYPDGGQRFCDTDGTRLVPDDLSTRISAGVFASILPSSLDTLREVGSPNDLAPTGDRRSSGDRSRDSKMEELFFEAETEDRIAEGFFAPNTTSRSADTITAPTTKVRHLDPKEIPKGHVDLAERSSIPEHFNDFDARNPASFVGKTVKGRYRVTEMIGEDDSGYAYLAEDHIAEDRRVVVRILEGFEDDDELTRSIYSEERVALSHLSHPNVARLIDSGSYSSGTEYVISEYVDGLNIDELLQIHGHFDGARAGRIIRQAATAISDVQREGVLHRDVRGANIVVSLSDNETETVTVTNFGVAGSLPNADNVAYKSPEVLSGRIANVGSDTYSLAIVAYEILTGQRPFEGNSASEIVSKQKRVDFVPVTTLRPELPVAVDAVFEREFAKESRSRFLSAREFGDAFAGALAQASRPTSDEKVSTYNSEIVVLEPANTVPTPVAIQPEAILPVIPASNAPTDPAWKMRSPDPIAEPDSRWFKIAAGSFVGLLILAALGWYFLINRPVEQPFQSNNAATENTNSPITAVDTVSPPQPRNIPQPENSTYYENLKSNLKGDLIRNFVGFKMYFPNSWKSNGSASSESAAGRGKFVDIARSTEDGKLKEQMLISYYPSKGTFAEDAASFPQLVKESNETLKKLIPSYQMLSQGEIRVNGNWPAYEIKFQGSGTTDKGERLLVWGRRMFIPAARQGVRNGFEITMLATSYAEEIRSVDDVGVNGELADILYSFEPSQNF